MWPELYGANRSNAPAEVRILRRIPAFMLMGGVLLVTFVGEGLAGNLLANPGFEQKEANWSTWPRKGHPAFAIDTQVAHRGGCSARIEVKEKDTDGSWLQRIPCTPNTSYEFSFYFKTAEPDKRISFLAEFGSADGQYAGQHRIEFTCRGNFWTRASGCFRTPADAVMMQFEVWANLDNTDVTTAWFDDCRLRELPPLRQMAMALGGMVPEVLQPAHRVLRNRDQDIVVRLPWSAHSAHGRKAQYRLSIERDGKTVVQRSVELAESIELKFPGALLTKDGAYILNSAIRWAGRERNLPPQAIVRQVDARQPPGAAILDEKGRLIVDGKPFFPIGVYWAPPNKWQAIKEHGFNTVHAWLYANEEADQRLQTAEALGLKVVVEMSDTLRGKCDLADIGRRVERMKDSPALLCWYPVDEPQPSGTPLQGLLESYNLIRQLDPFHPVLQVQCNTALLDNYGLACDIIATDPYGATTQVARWTRLSYISQRVPRAVWAVLRAFPTPDLPTPERLQCDTFIALINGAKGLLYFSFSYGDGYRLDQSPLWDAFRELNRRVAALAPVFLQGEKLDVPAGDAAVSQVGMWRHEGCLYVLAVNCKDESARLTFTIPKGLRTGSSAEVLFEDRTIRADDRIRDRFGPWGTRAYRVKLH